MERMKTGKGEEEGCLMVVVVVVRKRGRWRWREGGQLSVFKVVH